MDLLTTNTLLETTERSDFEDDEYYDDDGETEESSHIPMKPYLIAVICVGIVVGFIVLFKIYKQVKSGRLYNPCCDDGTGTVSSIHRRDTFKPLVRGGSTASDNGGSIYKSRSQRSGPDMGLGLSSSALSPSLIMNGMTSAMDMGNSTMPMNEGGMDMNQGGMDMGQGGMDMGNSMMPMYFYFGAHNVIVLFKSWVVNTPGQMVGACFGVFFLAALYEGLKVLREVLLQRSTMKARARQDGVSYSNGQLVDSSIIVTKPGSTIWSWSHLLQSFLHLIQVTVSYALMLIFMTYNGYLAISILLGACVGYFAFGWKKAVIIDVNEHCH